jgi:hypothetical protein
MGAQTALTLIQPTLFDYAALDRSTEVAARSDAALVKGLMRRTAEDLIDIGNALIRQKDALPHGMFLPWIATEFKMSDVTAIKMMNVAREYGGSKSELASDLSATALYELANPATPLEVRIEIEHRIEAGELVTAADIRELKADYAEVVELASEKTAQLTAAEQSNLDLIANAVRRAREENAEAHGLEIDALNKRLAAFEIAATDAMKPSDDNVVQFEPKADGDESDADPLGEGFDDVDLNNQRVGAHVIYGSLSSIDLAQTTPEVFWELFGTPNGKDGTAKWLRSTLKKLNAIKKGMPK